MVPIPTKLICQIRNGQFVIKIMHINFIRREIIQLLSLAIFFVFINID